MWLIVYHGLWWYHFEKRLYTTGGYPYDSKPVHCDKDSVRLLIFTQTPVKFKHSMDWLRNRIAVPGYIYLTNIPDYQQKKCEIERNWSISGRQARTCKSDLTSYKGAGVDNGAMCIWVPFDILSISMPLVPRRASDEALDSHLCNCRRPVLLWISLK